MQVSGGLSGKGNANKLTFNHDSVHRRKIFLEEGTVLAYERIPLKELCGMFLKYNSTIKIM